MLAVKTKLIEYPDICLTGYICKSFFLSLVS